jgi:ParB-like nuclease domain
MQAHDMNEAMHEGEQPDVQDTTLPPREAVALGTWPADQVERRPLASLLPYARNARTHSDEQITQLANSIREWGWTVPVLVDEEDVLIAGHGRVMAAQRLGLVDAPTIVARGWSDAQKRAYRIADNKLSLNAGWDSELLRLELSELEGHDVSLIGFSDAELKRLMDAGEAPVEFTTYDETIETQHECPRCKFRWSGKSAPRQAEAPTEEQAHDQAPV